MGDSIYSPVMQVFKDNGDPGVGYKLYTYESGTTTPKVVYTDEACTVPATNPVVFDSRGEATIYYADEYKFILRTDANILIWEVDGVGTAATSSVTTYAYYPDPDETDQGVTASGTGDTIYDILVTVGTSKYAKIVLRHDGSAVETEYNLDTSIDASNYPNVFFVPEPGAVLTRTTGDENLTVYSPGNIIASTDQVITEYAMLRFFEGGVASIRWYGAVGDDLTDNNGVINNAFESVKHSNSKVSLYIPRGTYLSSSYFDWDVDTYLFGGMFGDGWQSVIKFQNEASSYIRVENADGTVFRDFMIEFDTLSTRDTSSWGLKLNTCNHFRIENVKVLRSPNESFAVLDCNYGVVKDCFSDLSQADGIHIANCHDLSIENNFITRGGDDAIGIIGYDTGYTNTYSENIIVKGNHLYDGGNTETSTASSLYGGSIKVSGGKGVSIVGNIIDGANILLRAEDQASYTSLDSDGITISGNIIRDMDFYADGAQNSNWLAAIQIGAVSAGYAAGIIKNVTITGNVIENATYGFIRITNNYTSTPTFANFTITGNTFNGCRGATNANKVAGIYANPGMEGLIISNNYFYQSHNEGIQVNANLSQHAIITNNIFEDTGTYSGGTKGSDAVINCQAEGSIVANNVIKDDNNNHQGFAVAVNTADIGLVVENNVLEGWSRNIYGVVLSDQISFSKQKVSTGTSAPTTGTWAAGDVVYDITPSAGGTMGWVCTESGTFGAATDSTGDTDGTTATITGMTDTSDFAVGSFVTVSAGFPATGPYQIRAKTATSITITDASNSGQSNITVASPDPVFKTFGAITA